MNISYPPDLLHSQYVALEELGLDENQNHRLDRAEATDEDRQPDSLAHLLIERLKKDPGGGVDWA